MYLYLANGTVHPRTVRPGDATSPIYASSSILRHELPVSLHNSPLPSPSPSPSAAFQPPTLATRPSRPFSRTAPTSSLAPSSAATPLCPLRRLASVPHSKHHVRPCTRRLRHASACLFPPLRPPFGLLAGPPYDAEAAGPVTPRRLCKTSLVLSSPWTDPRHHGFVVLTLSPILCRADPTAARPTAQVPITTIPPFNDAAKLPDCAKKCGPLYDANGACVPPAAPSGSPGSYTACFCANAKVRPFAQGTTGVCDQACQGNDAGLQSIANWFRGICSASNNGAGANQQGGAKNDGGSDQNSGTPGPAAAGAGGGGDW